jgi:membrane protease YdiL (CAAX protease family)
MYLRDSLRIVPTPDTTYLFIFNCCKCNKMNGKIRFSGFSDWKPTTQLFISVFIILFLGLWIMFVTLSVSTLFPGVDWSGLKESISADSKDKNIILVRLVMILQDVSIFIIPGIVILYLMRDGGKGGGNILRLPYLREVLLVIILGFCIFPVTSFTGQFNAGLHLPGWLSGVEKWMTEKETAASSIIDLIVPSENPGILVLNLFIIAILPAIGEEVIFRGVFQRIFRRMFRSDHLAIWVTAFIFSALHFQFFGFIPRFILGLAFGYLFFWSRTLWLPVISHFVNNAVPVIYTYIHGMDKLNSAPDTPLLKQLIYLPLPVAIGLVILFYFRNKNIPQDIADIL